MERRGRGNTGHRARAHARHTGMPRVRARRGPSRCCTVYGDAPQAAPAVGWLEAGALCVSSTEYGCGVRMRRRAHDTHTGSTKEEDHGALWRRMWAAHQLPHALAARSEASRTYARRALRDDGKHGTWGAVDMQGERGNTQWESRGGPSWRSSLLVGDEQALLQALGKKARSGR